MIETIARGLRKIADFKGRDTRAVFWPYAIVVALAGFVGVLLSMAPEMIRMLSVMEAFAAAHPEKVTVTTGPASYEMRVDVDTMDFVPNYGLTFGLIGLVIATVVILLGAAVCRRLHDRGLSGFWGLIPISLLVIALIGLATMLPKVMTGAEPNIGVFLLIWLTGMISHVGHFALIVVLARIGTSGPNRFGPDPLTR